MLLIQVILGRAWVLEQPEGSDILKESPLKALICTTPWYQTKLHQCMYGQVLEGLPARKATELSSNVDVSTAAPSFSVKCNKEHDHCHVRGPSKDGVNLSSLSAAYPQKLVDTLLSNFSTLADSASGGETAAATIQILSGAWGAQTNH